MFDEILEKIEAAIAVLVGLIDAGHPLCGTASGKDSTCATILMLEAVRRIEIAGKRQPAHYISTANTTVENVSLARHIETMLEEIDCFAVDHALDVTGEHDRTSCFPDGSLDDVRDTARYTRGW